MSNQCKTKYTMYNKFTIIFPRTFIYPLKTIRDKRICSAKSKFVKA